MQILSLVWGIVALIGMLIGFIPCLGALNWLVIPFAAVGLVVSIVAFAGARNGNSSAAAGIALNAVALIVGTLRLILGGGIL